MGDSKKVKTNSSKKQIVQSDQESLSSVVIIREECTESRVNLEKNLKDCITGVEPINYEEELSNKQQEIHRDPLKNILLFPNDDIKFEKQKRELRTEYSTVPPQAFKDATSLFVNECLKVYTCDYHVLNYKYEQFGKSYHYLEKKPFAGVQDELQSQCFELDVDIDEADGVQDSLLAPTKEKGIYKEGYLTKSPFHSDGNQVFGSKLVESAVSKTYKRRWFTLKQTSNDGSYVLEYRKEEGSALAKGTLYLDSCNQITKGVKGRMYGFELHIQDKIYGLAADSPSDMEAWIKALCKATGIEIEQEKPTRSILPTKFTQLKHKNLRDSLKQSSHPILQGFAKETDQGNYKARQQNRQKIFALYPDLGNSFGIQDQTEVFLEPFRESYGYRFVLQCKDLKFKLQVVNESGDLMNCEPFTVILSLFDLKENKKVSEDFVCDLNSETNKEIFAQVETTASNGTAKEDSSQKNKVHSPKICVFCVDKPHQDIYLVIRINKMLQGGISQCAEPYFKSIENQKVAQKIHKQVKLASKRLSKFKMPFGWAARPVFNKDGEIDFHNDFSQIYKQETGKLSDEDFLKLLQELKSEQRLNKQVIPGLFSCSLSVLPVNHPNCYSPSLIPLKPFSRSDDIATSLEIQAFCRTTDDSVHPYVDYVNNMYIYPVSLSYNNQRMFKARNISCTVTFKDSDDLGAKPLKCIYQRDGTCSFTHQITCPVLYHNTSPLFFEEIKVLLPPQLNSKHHILFTFHHVSVEQPKESKEKKKDVVVPVGYCWLPVLENNFIRGDETMLPVAGYLPENYLSVKEFALNKSGTDVKWVDGKGQNLFKVNTKLISTIYTQDQHINNFFSHWQLSETKSSSASDVETSRLLKVMHAVDKHVLVRFLPAILNQLFQVLIQVNNEDVAVNVASLFIRITGLIHEVNRVQSLQSYVKYIFYPEDAKAGKTVHEELSKHLIFYLKLGADPTMIDNILQHSWFFFDIMVKSLAKNKESVPRKSRCTTEFQRSLENLVRVFINQLVIRAKDKPNVVKEANLNLASFLKRCLSHMDRGYVFQIINFLKDQYSPPDTQMFELKFEFFRSICEHEHYIALNLPIDIRIKGDVHESSLNDVFCKRHFLTGLLLTQISEALYQPKIVRKFAVRVLRNILVKHQLDMRYATEDCQSRIGALYIPFMTIMIEHSVRFHKNLERPVLDNSLLGLHRVSPDGLSSPVRPRNSTFSATGTTSPSLVSMDPSGKIPPILPFEDDESKEFMLCFLYILKSLKPVIIVDWWRDILTTPIKRPHSYSSVGSPFYYMQQDKHFMKFMAVIDFFDLLACSIRIFRYTGKKAVEEKSSSVSENTKNFLESKYASLPRPSPRLSAMINGHKRQYSNSSVFQGMSVEVDAEKRALLESNLSSEVALIVLDMVELFCSHFKFHLEQDDGDNVLMKKIFDVLMSFLRIGQSEYILQHVFASLRSFIHKFPTTLFKGSSNLCGVLCYEILRLCNSKIESIRTQASLFMYLLMRSNFEYTGKNCVRVHHQVIIAISQLIASGMNRKWLGHSLVSLKDYTADDKGLKNTDFPGEVRDLIKKVHTVLQATAQMKEHEDDLEVLVDLQYKLAKSYASTPELRQTWLQCMANLHEKNADYSEAAMCYIHSGALVAEYLRSRGSYNGGCTQFKHISPNILSDESSLNDDDADSADTRYSTKHLVELLEMAIDRLKTAERYEVMGDVGKLTIPLYEEERNYQRLAAIHGTLNESYLKICEVMMSGKRVLGRYYRVAFYGRVFKGDDGKEFIYKEPKLTSLPEISMRLNEKYSKKYDNVKLIQDSSKVKAEELNPAVNYIQVTFVTPYFDDDEYKCRFTDFEREHNIRRFVFETPFTLSGKAHGALYEQHKRKTILTTSHCFPYVKKRILVVQQEQYELSPIEVAIDEMQNKVKELVQVISLDPPDMKKLQLKLGGSVSVQVNAGPLAYAQTFLDTAVVKNYVAKHVDALQTTYREFVKVCGQALDLNGVLIKPDQMAYHEDLKERYFDLKYKVSTYAGELSPDLGMIQSPSYSSEA